MPEVPQQPDPWSLRASDADRDKYLALLQEAFAEGRLDPVEYEERMTVALAAKTYRDLYPVLADLPVDPARVPGPPVQPSSGGSGHGNYLPVAAPSAGASSALSLSGLNADNSATAIFSSTSRNGTWVVPTEFTAFAVFGEVKLDLTSAVLSGDATELRCNAVFGSVEITVPDAVWVDVKGTPILGDYETKDKRKGADKYRMPAPEAPRLRITGVALFGSVEVRIVVPKAGQPGVSMMKPPLMPPPTRPQIEGPHPDDPQHNPGPSR